MEEIVKYMVNKKFETNGYLRYFYYKNIISFIFPNLTDYFIRKIFQNLLDQNIIEKKKVGKQTFYKFVNPDNPDYKENVDIITFD